MNLELYRDVILIVDLPEHGWCAGDVGTVVERHDVPVFQIPLRVRPPIAER